MPMSTRNPIFVEARNVMRSMDRLTVPELATRIAVSYPQAREILETMSERGWVRKTDETVRTSPVQGRPADLYEYVKPTGRFQREHRKPPEVVAVEQYRDVMAKRGGPVAGSGKGKRAGRDEVRRFLAMVTEAGWTWEEAKHGYLVYHPDGYPVAAVPKTASDARSMPNTLADLKRAGFPMPVAA